MLLLSGCGDDAEVRVAAVSPTELIEELQKGENVSGDEKSSSEDNISADSRETADNVRADGVPEESQRESEKKGYRNPVKRLTLPAFQVQETPLGKRTVTVKSRREMLYKRLPKQEAESRIPETACRSPSRKAVSTLPSALLGTLPLAITEIRNTGIPLIRPMTRQRIKDIFLQMCSPSLKQMILLS